MFVPILYGTAVARAAVFDVQKGAWVLMYAQALMHTLLHPIGKPPPLALVHALLVRWLLFTHFTWGLGLIGFGVGKMV